MIFFSSELRNFLTGLGFNEALNIAIHTEDKLKYYFNVEALVTIRNPIGQFLNKLRPTLLYGLVRNASRNLNRGEEVIKLFEIGKTFYKDSDGEEFETESLGIILAGKNSEVNWKLKERTVNYFDLKGVAEVLGEKFRLKNFNIKPLDSSEYPCYLESGSAFGVYSGDNLVGSGGILSQAAALAEDIDQLVYVLELNMELLYKYTKKKVKFKPYSKYPPVYRDLSLILPDSVQVSELLNTMESTSRKLIKDINVFDVYKGKNIPKGQVSYAFSIKLQSLDKTLKDSDIEKVISKLLKVLENNYGAKLRE